MIVITPETGTGAEGEGQLQRDGNRNRGMDRVTGRRTHIGTETEEQRDWDRDRKSMTEKGQGLLQIEKNGDRGTRIEGQGRGRYICTRTGTGT